jgi:hypothetical protein
MFEKSENAPVSFTILLDTSGSMALSGKMDAARAAVGALVAHRRPGDDFALYVFSDTEAREVVPFTEDPSRITRALADVKPYGKTAFFDALATMPERGRLGKNPSRAIILLSDGIDNASEMTRAQLARRLEALLRVRRRHAHVDDRHVRRVALGDLQQLVRGRRLAGDLDAGAPQQRDDALADQQGVVGDDHAHGARASLAHAGGAVNRTRAPRSTSPRDAGWHGGSAGLCTGLWAHPPNQPRGEVR